MDNPNYIQTSSEGALERHIIHTYESADLVHQMQSERAPSTQGTQPSKYGYSEPIDSIPCGTQMHSCNEPLHTTSHGLPNRGHSHWKILPVGSNQPSGSVYYETPVDGKTELGQCCTAVDCCQSVIIKGRTYAVLMKTPLQPTTNEPEVNLVNYDRFEQP